MPIGINGSGSITGISAGGLPDATITQAELASGVSSTGPTFSAYQSSAQSLTNGVATKIQFQAENFDIGSCYDNATNYRFTPNVAGYYLITSVVQLATTAVNLIMMYKNGSLWRYGNYTGVNGVSPIAGVVDVVYLNGSTDYIEIYQNTTVSGNTVASAANTYFSGCLVRAA